MSGLGVARAIAGANLRRTFRERSSYFFVFAFPMMLILVLGMAYGGGFQPRVGVVAAQTPLASELVTALAADDGIAVERLPDEETLVGKVERGELEAGLVVPAGYDAELRSGVDSVALRYLARPGPQGQQVGSVVAAVVSEQAGTLRAARFAAAETGVGLDAARAAVDVARAAITPITVRDRTEGTDEFASSGRFDLGASSQLVLFIFITSMTTAGALIDTRRLGIARRMLAAPVRAPTIVLGEACGRVGIAVVQGGFIMLGSALVFGVRWGDPVAAVLLMVVFSLTAAGAGMLLGAVMRTPQQAVAIGLLLGLGLAALGGTMMPLEFFSPTMRTVAHLTPHAWAVDGFAALLRHDGGLLDVLPQLAVLLGAALALFALASALLRRAITDAAG